MTKKHPPAGAIARARALRRDMTEAEKAVWNLLRGPDLAPYKFRRQVPIGAYIADFASHQARLIVEIDGGQHDPKSPEEIARTRYLQAEGYRMLRFWNNDVLNNIEGAHAALAAALA